MRFLVLLLAFLVFIFPVFSQSDIEYAKWIENDLKQVDVVVNIQLEKVEIEGEWGKPKTGGGYTIYRFTGKVVESFKGKFKKGETLVFYSVIEGQPASERLKRNYIRFLEIKRTDKGEKQSVELENSARKIDQKTLSILRKLR